MTSTSQSNRRWRFSNIEGYFLQSDEATDSTKFEHTQFNGGLKPQSDNNSDQTDWQTFEGRVHRLNAEADKTTSYKVVYLSRHGQGDHNVAEAFYGREAWDAHFSKLDGNETANWVDAHLTETGIKQAQDARQFWIDQIATQKMPAPESWYSSPMDRCLATTRITFGGLEELGDRIFLPKVKELLRETNGEHTCDKRSSKTYIASTYPEFEIEEGFTENDELWRADWRESDDEIDARFQLLLEDMFEHDTNTFISFTAHSGAIQSVLRVIGHRVFRLKTGAVMPVLIKGERLS